MELIIKTVLVNVNGAISAPENAKISVFDRGFLYGDSVYEVTMTINKKPFLLKEHLDRLWYSARKMELHLDYSKEDIAKEVNRLIEELAIDRAYVRIIITRGEGEITLDPTLKLKNNLVIIAKQLPENPAWWYQKGLSMIVSDTLRNPTDSLDPSIKSGNYLNNVLAYSEAKKRGAFDAIMLNHENQVSEATTSNVWIIKDGRISTPPKNSGLLAGITRKIVLRIAKENKLDVHEEDFDADELRQADECFITSSTKLIVPVTKVDDELIGSGKPGDITLNLLKLYRQFAGLAP